MTGLGARNWLFGLNCWLAAVLALGIAFAFDLRNPWWALLTVFITSQPFAGAVASKAVYRVLGTLGGVAASLLIVPPLVDAPELMLLAIGAWIGLGLYLSLLRRGPEGYAFMLAGYTVALVGLPPLADPYAIFDIAVARAEEILIGVLSASLVHGLVFPRSAQAVVLARLDACLRDARSWLVAALDADPRHADPKARQRLAADLTELSLLAAHLPFEPQARRSATGVMRALELRLISLLPLLTAVEDRLAALREAGPLPPRLQALVERLRGWIADGDPAQAGELLAECRALMPEARPGAAWPELLRVNLLGRIEELVEAWHDGTRLAALLRHPALATDPDLLPLIRGAARRDLHIDHGLAALSGLAAMLSVIGAGAFAMAADWSEGFTAVSMAGVMSCLFATADDPSPLLRRMLVWTLAAIPVSMLYVFAILPAIDGFPLLMLALAPMIVVVGAALSVPQHGLRALSFSIAVSAGLALQSRFSPDFVAFANANLAVVTGNLVTLTVMRLIRVVSGEDYARRVLRAGWRDLAGLAVQRRTPGREAWVSRMLDRLALLLPRLAQADPAENLHLSDALGDLRMGINIVDLRDAATQLPRWPVARVQALMDRCAQHFRRIARDGPQPPDEALREQLDTLIAELLFVESREWRLQGVAAGVGLRRNLFPTAPAFGAATD